MTDRYLSPEQLAQLCKPINPERVHELDGNLHLQSWDVIAHLIRIFGFLNWDQEISEYRLLYEEGIASDAKVPHKKRYSVGYSATCRLTIMGGTTREDVGFGDSVNQPSRGAAHHIALTSAVAAAMKRAARTLGNQFGLSLYHKEQPYHSAVGFTLGAKSDPLTSILGEPEHTSLSLHTPPTEEPQ